MGGRGARRGHEQEQEGRDSHYLRQRKHNVMFKNGSKKESGLRTIMGRSAQHCDIEGLAAASGIFCWIYSIAHGPSAV